MVVNLQKECRVPGYVHILQNPEKNVSFLGQKTCKTLGSMERYFLDLATNGVIWLTLAVHMTPLSVQDSAKNRSPNKGPLTTISASV